MGVKAPAAASAGLPAAASVALTRGARRVGQVDHPTLGPVQLCSGGAALPGVPHDLGTFYSLVTGVKLVSWMQMSEFQVIVSCLKGTGLSTF